MHTKHFAHNRNTAIRDRMRRLTTLPSIHALLISPSPKNIDLIIHLQNSTTQGIII